MQVSLHLDNRHAIEHAREYGPDEQGPVRAHQIKDDRVLERSSGHNERTKEDGVGAKGEKLASSRLLEDPYEPRRDHLGNDLAVPLRLVVRKAPGPSAGLTGPSTLSS